MWLYVILTVLVSGAYVFLISFILKTWYQIPEEKQINPKVYEGLTILIPARNEEDHISSCIQSILENESIDRMPLQILVIDDHSEDATSKIVNAIQDNRVQCISLKNHLDEDNSPINAYKKAAINVGIEFSQHSHIVQLDADTVVSEQYLKTVQNYIESKNPFFLAGPIIFSSSNTWLEKFQQLDIMGMMAVTAAGIRSKQWYMANGANMIYQKLGHDFDTNSNASGDDVFTIQKIAQSNPERIYFAKNKKAIVSTEPVNTFKDFYKQRLRWATKNKSMDSLSMQLMMVIPFINAIMIIGHLFAVLYFGQTAWVLFVFHLTLKCLADYVLLDEMSRFFDQEKTMKSFLWCNILHVLYIAVIGLLSLFVKNYEWKGRRVN